MVDRRFSYCEASKPCIIVHAGHADVHASLAVTIFIGQLWLSFPKHAVLLNSELLIYKVNKVEKVVEHSKDVNVTNM